MLSPYDRTNLVDALKPPAGFVLDAAVGTSYTLDLEALLTAPVAFALYDALAEREERESERAVEPVALLEAVRRHADAITLFCQAGAIAVPARGRSVLAWLEDVVVECAPPASRIFHPKVWVMRFVDPNGTKALRVLCLSRNLTFDRSWDTVLRLDAEPQDANMKTRDDASLPLARFLEALPSLAVREPETARRQALASLADDVRRARFVPPPGFDEVRFWPLGIEGAEAPALDLPHRRVLVCSPFLAGGLLDRLTRAGSGHVLVSRPETLDRLGRRALSRFADVFVLSGDADVPTAAPAESDSQPTTLNGLHAKLFVLDGAGSSSVLCGSANATMAAFDGNVEFICELRDASATAGVDSLLEVDSYGPGFRGLLERYEPPAEPTSESPKEALDRSMDELSRAVGSLGWAAAVVEHGEAFRLTLTSGGPIPSPPDLRLRAWVWPITLGAEHYEREIALGKPVREAFPVSLEALTAFFAIRLEGTSGELSRSTSFIVNAKLDGAPEGRLNRILSAMLRDPERFLRYLLLLLNDPMDDLTAIGPGMVDGLFGSGRTYTGATGMPILETLVRALARYPERLTEVDEVIADLRRTGDGTDVFPPGFDGVWEAVWAARERLAE